MADENSSQGREGCAAMSAPKRKSSPPELEPYRERADALSEALDAVKAVQEQTAAITLARDAAASKRQSLLSNWTDTEEESVTELSKLAARGEVFAAKLAAQADKLASAQAELKAALAAFAISFNALFLSLRTFLIKDAGARIAAMLHPSVRAISGASIGEIAVLATEVIELDPLAIRVEAGVAMFNSILPPENIERAAEWSLPKAGPMLATAQQQLERGFVPPAPFSLEKVARESESCRRSRSLSTLDLFRFGMLATGQV